MLCFFGAWSLPAAAMDRTALDYLNLCRQSETEADFVEALEVEEDWVEIELDANPPILQISDSDFVAVETLAMLANFSAQFAPHGSGREHVRLSDLEYFNVSLDGRSRLFPVGGASFARYFFNQEPVRFLAYSKRRGGRGNCYYASLNMTPDRSHFSIEEEVGRLHGGPEFASATIKFQPSFGSRSIAGHAHFAESTIFENVFDLDGKSLSMFAIMFGME